MKTLNHTPGPWILERDRAKSLSIYGDTTFIGEVYHEVDEPSPEENANARLIAAAPDLLDACRMALSCMAPDDNDITARALRAAIAKATGGAQ
jgi:hypothetical protein